MTEESADQAASRPSGSGLWLASSVVVMLVVIAVGAYVVGRSAREGGMPEVVYDVEYDYLGALETWPAPGSEPGHRFVGLDDEDLVHAGRRVCVHATDRGMDFDGMTQLLDLDPHQVYAVVTEALDKLCPSLEERRDTLLGEGGQAQSAQMPKMSARWPVTR